ncbi:hypothetical protein ACIBLB_23070 [Streptosporangium canum]|uniref:hypothetical protein n=1 Tax=Streptosporangium canum TaxID=324952 RepID=UPI00379E5680
MREVDAIERCRCFTVEPGRDDPTFGRPWSGFHQHVKHDAVGIEPKHLFFGRVDPVWGCLTSSSRHAMRVVISGRPSGFDKTRYRARNTVEWATNKLKQSRAVVTRYDKRGYVFLGTVTAAALLIRLRS